MHDRPLPLSAEPPPGHEHFKRSVERGLPGDAQPAARESGAATSARRAARVRRTSSVAKRFKVALLGLGSAAVVAVIWSVAHSGAARTPALSVTPVAVPLAAQTERDVLAPSPVLASARTPPNDLRGARMPAPARVRETLSSRAELFAPSAPDDHDRSTFSFEYGLRDDPTGITRDDWDIEFTGTEFEAVMAEDDVGVITDLGDLRVDDLWAWNGALPEAAAKVPVLQGHTYFLWSRDHDTNLAVAFNVLELVPGERCTLEWYATADGKSARASFHDQSPWMELAAKLIALRKETRRPGDLREARVWLQGRNGAGGGNPFRVDIAGGLLYFRTRAQTPLDPTAPIDKHEKGSAYCEGGRVPEGNVFVVTRVDYWGFAKGDSNGRGGFAVVIAGERIVEHAEAEPTSGTWTGRIEIPTGAEKDTYLELRNSSAGEAILSGEFVDQP